MVMIKMPSKEELRDRGWADVEIFWLSLRLHRNLVMDWRDIDCMRRRGNEIANRTQKN